MPRALILIADGHDEDQLQAFRGGLAQQGFEVQVAGPSAGTDVRGSAGTATRVTKGPLNLNLGGYDLLVVPGGDHAAALVANKSMGNVVYSMAHKGRALALVGAAVELLVPAAKQKMRPNPAETGTHILQGDILTGRKIACGDSLREAIEGAGATCGDEEIITDGPIVTAQADADPVRVLATAVPLAHRFRAMLH